MKKGLLVSFEGGEACGKSTQIKLFEQYLQKNKIDYILTREPGGTELGEKIRALLLDNKQDMSANTEFLLFSASRSKLIESVVKPALKQGKVVVMDRFYDSSFAYQGYAGNLNLKDIDTITKFAIGEGATPDITFLLDISYEDGMERKSKDENLRNLDRFETKGKAYHDKVRKGYLERAKAEPKRFRIIDAKQTKEKVSENIVEEFEKIYKDNLLSKEK